jgi:hypothetical protein
MKLMRAEDSHVMVVEKWSPERRSCQIWGVVRVEVVDL